MVATHEVYVVVNVVRVRHIVCVDAAGVELEPTIDDEHHVTWGICIGIHTDIIWTEEFNSRAADYYAGHSESERVNGVRADEISTTDSKTVGEVFVASIRRISTKKTVRKTIRMRRAVFCNNVALEYRVLRTRLIIDLVDDLILAWF